MFFWLILGVVIVVALALLYAYAGSKDVFHPVMFIGPMLVFMYAWMPYKLDSIGGLAGFFQRYQLDYVERINLIGVTCFLLGCLAIGCRIPATEAPVPEPKASSLTLLISGVILGCTGLVAWVVTVIHGSGGDLSGYRGGWDDSGYIRDASLLLFPSFLLILSASLQEGLKILHVGLMTLFIMPSILEAAASARRGPTFMIAVTLTLGYFLNRRKRPSLVLTAVAGTLLGFLMLFLVSNRQNIYLGSDRALTTDVTDIVEKPDTGNEFIYGTGTILSVEQRDTYYWGWRYIAQVLIRPIPSSIWPTKYEDFGLPELKHNAGTGEGFEQTLGWTGADGSAPGVIADLWAEFHWFNLLALFAIGALYGFVWRKAQLQAGPWTAQYIIMAALSVYLVMQTMEAVIFRLLILSIPLRFSWWLARRNATPEPRESPPCCPGRGIEESRRGSCPRGREPKEPRGLRRPWRVRRGRTPGSGIRVGRR